MGPSSVPIVVSHEYGIRVHWRARRYVVKDHRCSRAGPALAVQVSRLLMVVTDSLVVGRVGEI